MQRSNHLIIKSPLSFRQIALCLVGLPLYRRHLHRFLDILCPHVAVLIERRRAVSIPRPCRHCGRLRSNGGNDGGNGTSVVEDHVVLLVLAVGERQIDRVGSSRRFGRSSRVWSRVVEMESSITYERSLVVVRIESEGILIGSLGFSFLVRRVEQIFRSSSRWSRRSSSVLIVGRSPSTIRLDGHFVDGGGTQFQNVLQIPTSVGSALRSRTRQD